MSDQIWCPKHFAVVPDVAAICPHCIEEDRAAVRQADADARALLSLPEVEQLRVRVAALEAIGRRLVRASQGSVAQLKALHELAGLVAE